MQLKIGELAKRAGLSVRALHHYDAIGLLSPSVRTTTGVRLYGQVDLIRLHRIQLLKQLDYSLPDIGTALSKNAVPPLDAIRNQANALDAQARHAKHLATRLRELAEQLATVGAAGSADWLDVLEMMAIYDRHLTPQELSTLRKRVEPATHALGRPWKQLVGEVGTAMHQRLGFESAGAQALAWRWVRLVIATTHNDAALANKMKSLLEQEIRAQDILGINSAMFTWISLAIAHARLALFAKYLTRQQFAKLKHRYLTNMANKDEWPLLVAQVRQQMAAGAPSSSPSMQALAQRWNQLFRDSYCGNDTAMETNIRHAFTQEPDLTLGVGVDADLLHYVHLAAQALEA